MPGPRSFSSSSRGRDSKKRSFQRTDALSFTISPEQALVQFQDWAYNDQGLNWLMRWNSVRISAAYVPMWSFDLNIRYVLKDPQSGSKRYDWKPSIFAQAYGKGAASTNHIIHVSGLASYAGHNFRRSLVNPIHNTSLVFLGDQLQPFASWMLRDMKLSNGEILQVDPDPWNATKARAMSIVHDELEAIAQLEEATVTVQTELVSARRVYMPTYVVDYSVLGLQYRAFLSGCDAGAGVSGVSHKVVDVSKQDMQQASNSFLSTIQNAAQLGARALGNRQIGTLLLIMGQTVISIAARILPRIPIIGLAVGALVGFRKIIQPWMNTRLASAEWERQREREAMEEAHDHPSWNAYRGGNDFVDTSGAAKRYFTKNKARIIKSLGGENAHEKGNFDWYKDWEEWARKQWEEQQRQQQQQQQQQYGGYGQQQESYGSQQQQQQQRQQQRRQRQQKKKPEYQWDFDPNDPYSVLGIKPGASKSEVSAAFRREMLKHHPDVQAGASEAAKERAVERSKHITGAYQKLKKQMK